MSSVDLHAAVLLAAPLVTGVLCLVLPHRRPTSHQATQAAMLAGVVVFVIYGLNTHLCLAGNPAWQCVIIGACLWTVVAFLKSKWVRTGIAVVMVGFMYLLSMHFGDLVHGKGWIGNVGYLAPVESMMQSQLANIRDTIGQAEITEETVFPEDWLRSLPIGTDLKDVIGNDLPYRVESRRVWHTRFTGLHRIDKVEQDYWYPGGRLSDTATHISLKDVP